MKATARNYFDEDFLDFFKELAANNNKEWFDSNRKRYEQTVKKPFEVFIQDLISEVQKIDSSVQIAPKDAIFRINRDIRFSKDKAPYKLDRTAVISEAGRKDKSVPGMYVGLGPEKLTLGGGAYVLDPNQLQRLRAKIVEENTRFEKILKDDAFKRYFPKLLGEENKRLPANFSEAATKQPLLFKKQLYYMHYLEPELITSSELLPTAVDHFKAGFPMQEFLKEAV